jgi:hypothetical protein
MTINTTNTLTALIEAHRAAAARFLRAARAADPAEAAEDGRAVTVEDLQEYETAADEERAAAVAIFSHPCSTIDDIEQKAVAIARSPDLLDDLAVKENAVAYVESMVHVR